MENLAIETLSRYEVAQLNKAAIIAAMKSLGIESIEVTYSGSGDAGQTENITFTPEGARGVPASVTYVSVDGCYNHDAKKWAYKVTEKPVSLSDASAMFTDGLIELHQHSGDEINEGGGGSVTITAATCHAQHDHYDNVVETVSSSHEL